MDWYLIGLIALRLLGLAFVGTLGFKAALAVGRQVRAQRGRHGARLASRAGLAVLAERYARGEIDAAEFAERKAVLEG
jgi:uncharacterized membrane protein